MSQSTSSLSGARASSSVTSTNASGLELNSNADMSRLTTASTASPDSAPSAPSAASDPLGFVWDLKGNPCFRTSLMWGIGVGAAMGVHSFTRHKLPYKASDAAVKTFFGVSALSWLWCRHRARKEKETFDAVIDLQLAAQQRRKAEEASGKATGHDAQALEHPLTIESR